MRRWKLGTLVGALAVLVDLGGLGSAHAQPMQGLPPPPAFPLIDRNGVDLSSAELKIVDTTPTSVGDPADGGLSRTTSLTGVQDELSGAVNFWTEGFGIPLSFGGRSLPMGASGSNQWASLRGGDTMTYNPATQIYTFVGSDGTVAEFDKHYVGNTSGMPSGVLLKRLTKPNGETLTYTYVRHTTTGPLCQDFTSWPTPGQPQIDPSAVCQRLQAVVSNRGYMLKYEYAGPPNTPGSGTLIKVVAINLAHEYCDPFAESCSLSLPWSQETFSHTYGQGVYNDPYGGSTPYTYLAGLAATDGLNRTTTFAWSGFPSNPVSVISSPSGVQTTIDTNGFHFPDGTWYYSAIPTVDLEYPENGIVRAAGAQDPSGAMTELFFNNISGQLLRVKDPRGKLTFYTNDFATTRVLRITRPEGDYTQYGYDSRGNITSVTEVAKPGSPLPNRISTATYPASCANPKTCNKPISVTLDGATTDYTYDPNSGAVATVTGPPGADGKRPQVRYTYEAKYAWYKDASGALVQAPTPVYRVTEVSSCALGASAVPPAVPACVGTADETRTIYAYGVAGQANNLQVTAKTLKSGDDTLIATTDFTYDIRGDAVSVDGPLAGTVDKAYARYDRERQKVGEIAPDPDGVGARPHVAIKTIFDPDGRPSQVERGTVAGPSDAQWTAFAAASQDVALYDAAGRVREKTFRVGGLAKSMTQYSYNSANRLECVAIRMNPDAYGAPPASACQLGTAGAFGPDRITKAQYDPAGNRTSVTKGFGTPAAAVEQRTYSDNGKLTTVADGNSNLTTYEYDGFDRLWRTRFPMPSSPGFSSGSDYTELTYNDITWRVSSERLRDGQAVTYTRDQRGNALTKSLPIPTTYTYDNHDRIRAAVAAGQTVTETYDALGRKIATGGPVGSFGYLYNLAGQRVRLTWPDAFYVTYDVDYAGAVTAIRENGGAELVSLGYDNLGRRQTITRPNGVTTTYAYDTAQRLGSMIQDLPGTVYDQTLSFQYNPAAQIVQRTTTNSVYAWRDLYSQDRSYTINGLNQVGTNAGVSITYDPRGNLYNDGTRTYGYDAANRLTTVSTSASLAYDPIGRLERAVSPGGATTRFGYDGDDVVGEYGAAGGLLRRYVHGPGIDEPMVQYDGTGTETKRWLIADPQGSIVAAIDPSGTPLSVNRYDEYGVRDQGNAGRFQYTGQMYLPEVELYHYKARAYSATLGRFMQTDPIGYESGLNLYAYVGDDPVNKVDPTGKVVECMSKTGCERIAEFINKNSYRQFRFEDGKLREDPTKKNPEGSKKYSKTVERAVAAKTVIGVRIGSTLTESARTRSGNEITAVWSVAERGEGLTSTDGRQVVVTGASTVVAGQSGRINASAADILMHEFVEHAVPRALDGFDRPGVRDDNAVRGELGLPLRSGTDHVAY